MNEFPACPKCHENYTYVQGDHFTCPMCAHEWHEQNENDTLHVFDANGNRLKDGDSIIIIKDLKVKGARQDLKKGTKVKNIKLKDSNHNIDCKIEGFGAMLLKSEFVKKA